MITSLYSRARPPLVQDVAATLTPVRIIAENTQEGKTARQDNLSRRDQLLFAAIVATTICPEHQPKLSVVLISDLLHFTDKETEVAFTKKPTYKSLFTSVVTAKNHAHCH